MCVVDSPFAVSGAESESEEEVAVIPRLCLRPREVAGDGQSPGGSRGMTRPSSLNGVGRSPRRGVLAAGGALGAALVLPGRAWAAPVAQTTPAASPNALAAEAVYFEETGHTVSGDFWRHWQARGLDAYGFPISEPFEDGGVRNQYFQRARFELGRAGPGAPGDAGDRIRGRCAPGSGRRGAPGQQRGGPPVPGDGARGTGGPPGGLQPPGRGAGATRGPGAGGARGLHPVLRQRTPGMGPLRGGPPGAPGLGGGRPAGGQHHP